MSLSVSQVKHADDAQFFQLTPQKSLKKKDCPTVMTPAYSTEEWVKGKKVEQCYTLARIVGKRVKHPLDYTHYDLEQVVNLIGLIDIPQPPNILAAKISFLVKVDDHKPRFFEFGLKCKNKDGRRYSLFSFQYMDKKFEKSKHMYRSIGHFHDKGKEIFNSGGKKCGHSPDYEVNENGKLKQGQARFIHHTEQLLVAYLARPETSEELRLQLEVEISAKYPNFKKVMILGMGIHFHSIRICCGPCEYSLAGLINDKVGIKINNERLGLFPNIVKQFPKNGFSISENFRIISTGTSNINGNGHSPKYKEPKRKEENDLSSHDISLFDEDTINLYQTFLNNCIESAGDSARLGRRKSKTLFVSGQVNKEEKEAVKNVKEQEKAALT